MTGLRAAVARPEPTMTAAMDVPGSVTTTETASTTTAPPRPWSIRRRGLLPWLALLVVLALYGWFLLHHFAPAISEPDDNGYFAQGTLLAQSGRTWFVPVSD